MQYIEISKEIGIYLLYFGCCDFFFLKTIGNKARWYQLHIVPNLLVVNYIAIDCIEIYKNPIKNYKLIEDHSISILILSFHLYHIIFFKLNMMDYFHHILFVLLGIIPSIIFIKSNQIYLGYICGMGIPGAIEYSLLTLYKNDYITKLTQKKLNSYLYNYIRYPMCIYGSFSNIINRQYNMILLNDSLYISIYLNLLLFLNGGIFNYLTIQHSN